MHAALTALVAIIMFIMMICIVYNEHLFNKVYIDICHINEILGQQYSCVWLMSCSHWIELHILLYFLNGVYTIPVRHYPTVHLITLE